MKKRLPLLALPLLTLTSCGGNKMVMIDPEHTGTLVGTVKQGVKADSTDELFVFSVKVTTDSGIITTVEINEELDDLLLYKSTWAETTKTRLQEDMPAFLDQFENQTITSFYNSLIKNEDGNGATVRFDNTNFASGPNNSKYKKWSSIKTSETNANPELVEVKNKGRLIEIGIILSVFQAITK